MMKPRRNRLALASIALIAAPFGCSGDAPTPPSNTQATPVVAAPGDPPAPADDAVRRAAWAVDPGPVEVQSGVERAVGEARGTVERASGEARDAVDRGREDVIKAAREARREAKAAEGEARKSAEDVKKSVLDDVLGPLKP